MDYSLNDSHQAASYCTYCVSTYLPTYLPTYLHVRTYIYTYILTYIHTYLFTYIHTYLLTSIHPSIHACMHTYIHTLIMYAKKKYSNHSHSCCPPSSNCFHRFQLQCQELWLEVLYLVLQFIAEAVAIGEAFAIFFHRRVTAGHRVLSKSIMLCPCFLG